MLAAERESLQRHLAEMQEALAVAHSAKHELSGLSTTKDELAKQFSAMQAEFENTKRDFGTQIDALVAGRAGLERNLEEARQSLAQAQLAGTSQVELLAQLALKEETLAAARRRLEEIEREASVQQLGFESGKSALEERLQVVTKSLEEFRSSSASDHAGLVADKANIELQLAQALRAQADLRARTEDAAKYQPLSESIRAERDQARATLDQEQRNFRETIAANARDTEQLRASAESVRGELAAARALHSQVMSMLEKEREHSSVERTEQDRKLAAVDDARHQLAEALAASERTVKHLESELGETTRNSVQAAEHQKAEMAGLRAELDGARQEAEQARRHSNAVQWDFQQRLAALEEKAVAANAEAQVAAAAREEALAKAETERARIAAEAEQEIRRKAGELEVAHSALAALERENIESKAVQESIARQRDELARRIARASEEQRRILEGLTEAEIPGASQRSVLPSVVPPHIVEMSDADLVPVQKERVIKMPPARPVTIAPPKVRTV